MKDKLFSKNYIRITLSAGLFYSASFMLGSVSAQYGLKLGGGNTIGGIVAGIFTFSAFFSRARWGIMADRRGKKFIYVAGRLVCISGAAFSFFSSSLMMLIFSRRLFGLGYSAVTTAGGAMVCDRVPGKNLPQAIAIYGATGVIAQALAPSAALWLYKISFPAVALAAALLTAGALFSVLAVKYDGGEALPEKTGFALFEKQALPRAQTIFFFAAAVSGIYAFIPIYTSENNGGSRGVFFMVSSAALLVLRLTNGLLCHKLGQGRVFAAGCGMLVLSFVVLAAFSGKIPFYIGALLYGSGGGIVHPIVNTAAVRDVAPSKRALATATFMMGQDLGGGIGSLSLGFVSQNFGYRPMFISAAVFAAVMGLLYARLLKNKG